MEPVQNRSPYGERSRDRLCEREGPSRGAPGVQEGRFRKVGLVDILSRQLCDEIIPTAGLVQSLDSKRMLDGCWIPLLCDGVLLGDYDGESVVRPDVKKRDVVGSPTWIASASVEEG